MKFIVAKKQKMTQIFDNEGRVQPVTVLQAQPMTVTQIRTLEKDGYSAAQFSYGTKKESKLKRAQKGHYGDLGSFSHSIEYRLSDSDTAPVKGDTVTAESFEEGAKVIVRGTSKGKGFQGVVKRHNFGGGPRSHGQKHTERAPGSIGSTGPQRVFKGTKMGGRMGGDAISVKNLIVVKIDAENNLLYIKGAVPGRPGSQVEVYGN